MEIASSRAGDPQRPPVSDKHRKKVLLVDRRTAPPPTMEEARPQVVALLQRELIDQKVKELRTGAKIETFNLDGSKPSGAPAAPAAPKP